MNVKEAEIAADKDLPLIRITRDFHATPAQLMKAHTDPELFARWVGPDGMDTRVLEWDARNGGSWRYISGRDGEEFGFRGCFHTVAEDKIVQTFTFEGMPDDVSLETLWFEDLGDGRTRLHGQSLVASFEERDAWLASGMETGVNEGYAKLDALVGALNRVSPLANLAPADRHRAVAAGFTGHVAVVRDWEAPTPVDGWVARDIVGHLVGWFTDFLSAGGLQLPPGPGVQTDPAAAWQAHVEGVQALLDGATADAEFSHPMAGTHRLADAVDRFYTADVFMHTWDLAAANGQAPELDPGFAAQLLDGMSGIDELLRSSGQYGPAFTVPDDADPVTRLAGFIGRDPSWISRDS